MITQEKEKIAELLNDLQQLLQTQLLALKNNELKAVEALIEKSDKVAAELASTSGSPEKPAEYGKLMQLYKEIELTIQAQKDITNRQLLKVQNGKTTIRAYGNRIQ